MAIKLLQGKQNCGVNGVLGRARQTKNMVYKKIVVVEQNGGQHCSRRLRSIDEKYRAQALADRVSTGTAAGYKKKALEIRRVGGSLDYEGMVRFMRKTHRSNRNPKGKYVAATLRTYKSAMSAVLLRAGYPLTYEEDADLNLLASGLEAAEPTRAKRAAISEEQLATVTDAARRCGLPDIGDGLQVLFGVTCRPRDVGELTGARVDLMKRTATVRSKLPKWKQAQQGEWETHPIICHTAFDILSKAKQLHGNSALFPGWNQAVAGNFVKAAAAVGGWKGGKFDGAHCVRHGAASAVLNAALQQVRLAGGWKTVSSAKHYSRAR